MIPRIWRIFSPLLGFLFLLAVLNRSSTFTALARNTLSDLQQPLQNDFIPSDEGKRNTEDQDINHVVQEIWSSLRELEPTWKDGSNSPRPTAFLDILWYYTKATLKALFMNTPTQEYASEQDEATGISEPLRNAVERLQIAASYDDRDAVFLLAEMNFFGNFSYPPNYQEAFKWYSRLDELDGNATAQYMIGLMHATGIGGVERDQAKSMLYHTFAAEQGNIRSEMTLAFRYHSGIGTSRDCNKAVTYYKRVADKAMTFWQSGPPGGYVFSRNSYRWAEVTGGVYGEGASASSSGPNAQRDSITPASVESALDYLDMQERQGNYAASLSIGQYYYEAPRGYKRNLRMAQRQFMKIARAYWGKDGKVNPRGPKGIDKTAGRAAAYIGRMFLRGEGMEQNFEKAIVWLRRGIANGDSFAQYHMGLVYRDGLGVPKDGNRAGTYLKAAAEQSLSLAQSALGVLFLDQGDLNTAGRYFELAASAGNLEAFYYLAELTNKGVGRERNCGLATVYYKVVSEKAEMIHSSFAEANSAYERGDYERAFVSTLMAAEQGYEHAQANVAFLLDKKTAILSLSSVPGLAQYSSTKKRSKLLDDATLALVYLTRSSKQSNVDSLVKMGDYYISGDGTEDSTPNLERAVQCYTSAAETHHSAQAMWNLGWMHENGVGSVTQDFHMAKRYYDLALELNKEAYLPVKLALTKLRLRSWWNTVSGGKINSIQEDEEEEQNRPKTFGEWLSKFLDAAEEMDAQEMAAMREGDDMELDSGQYGDPDGPRAEGEYTNRNDGYGAADEWDELDDGLIESLIIIALAGVLALLVYARQVRQRALEEERRRQLGQGANGEHLRPQQPQQAQQQGPGQGGGFFPRPGDPEFNNWAVGGVGH